MQIVKAEDIFFESFIKSFYKLKKEENIEVIYNTNENDNNFYSVFPKLKKGKFDILGVLFFPGQVSTFYRQLKASNINMPTFGTDIFGSKEEVRNAKGSMSGAIYPVSKAPDKFRKKYIEKFKNDTHLVFAYNAYLFCKLLAKLVVNYQTENMTSLELMEALKAEVIKDTSINLKETEDNGTYFDFPIVLKTVS